MRWEWLVLVSIPGCALDWSRADGADAGSGGAAGSGGSGGISAGGSGASTTGGSGGVAGGGSGGVPSGGSGGGGAPGGGTGGTVVACDSAACVGLECGAAHPCAGATQPCCVDEKNCAKPASASSVKQYCVPTGCWDGTSLHCGDAACGDQCGSYGLTCCQPEGVCKQSCS